MSQRSGGATSEKPERPGRGDNRDGRRAAAPRNHRAPRWAKTQAGPERDALWQLDAETGIGSSTTAPVPRVLSGRTRAHAPALEIRLLPQETDMGPACPAPQPLTISRTKAAATIARRPRPTSAGRAITQRISSYLGAADGDRQDTIGSFPWPVLPLLPFRTRHPRTQTDDPIVIAVSGVAHASRRTPPPRATRTCLDQRRRRRHRRAERVR